MNDNKEFQDVFSGNEEAEKENRGFDFPKPPVNKSQSEAYAEPEKKEEVKAEEAAEVKKEETEKAEPVKKRKYTRRATADTAKKTEKKAAKPKAEMVVETYIQYQNCEVNHADIVEKIKALVDAGEYPEKLFK